MGEIPEREIALGDGRVDPAGADVASERHSRSVRERRAGVRTAVHFMRVPLDMA